MTFKEIDGSRKAIVAPLPKQLAALLQSVTELTERNFIGSIERNGMSERLRLLGQRSGNGQSTCQTAAHKFVRFGTIYNLY